MRKVVAGLFISLDGVVESPSDWLISDDEMWAEMAAGIAQADAVLLGRRTYLEFAKLWPAQGNNGPMATFLNNSPKYIVSRSLTSPLGWANSRLLGGDLAAGVARLKEQPGKNIQVPGSPTLVRSLLSHGLLDELALGIQPVVLGSGLRLFDQMTRSVRLKLTESRTFANGAISATYHPVAG